MEEIQAKDAIASGQLIDVTENESPSRPASQALIQSLHIVAAGKAAQHSNCLNLSLQILYSISEARWQNLLAPLSKTLI
jgi:hypothetical protein